jgi:hypothetical protein
LEISRDIKDIPEIKSSLSQLMGMVTSLLDKDKQPIHLEEDVAIAGCGVSQQWENSLEENQQALKGFKSRL